MRKSIVISVLCLASVVSLRAQAINVTTTGVGIGTTAPASRFHIKDPGATFTAEVNLARFDYYNGRSLNVLGPLIDDIASPFTIQTKNALQFRMDDTNVMIIDAIGNVGVGTVTPSARLTVTNNDDAKIKIYSNGGSVGVIDAVANTNESTNRWLSINPSGGNVGVGTSAPTERLTVNGKVKSRGYITDTSAWSDYVFSKDYKLPALSEVEQHIAEKGHLPGIPSEKEAITNGVDLGDMQVRLLAQIEQLTLHMIAHEKAIDALKRENASLRRELKAAVESDQHDHASQ